MNTMNEKERSEKRLEKLNKNMGSGVNTVFGCGIEGCNNYYVINDHFKDPCDDEAFYLDYCHIHMCESCSKKCNYRYIEQFDKWVCDKCFSNT